MKINLVSLLMLFGGGILLYSGIKGYAPQDVIQWGLGGPQPVPLGQKKDWKDSLSPQDKSPIPGDRYPGDVGLPEPDTGTTPA